jgi:hypothetical protein
MAHKGKTTSDVSYNPEDPPEAYSNPTIYTHINEYTSATRSLHGDDCDPSSQDFDLEVVMRIGGVKKHGRYYLGDGVIDVTAWAVLSWRRRHRRDLYSLSLQDPSTEHGHKHSHTPTAGHFTTTDYVTPGDSCFIHRTLIFTYLSFALFKYCGEMLQAQLK